MIALGRLPHHPSLLEPFAKAALAPQNSKPLEAMRHHLQTPAGRRLFALRKQIPEPVFGIIKSVMGFRRFLLRRLDRGQGEWSLVKLFEHVYAPLTARLLLPVRADAAIPRPRRSQLDGLYQNGSLMISTRSLTPSASKPRDTCLKREQNPR
jgi:hypothetical protein